MLLKNDGDLLPLPKTLNSIAVIGPNADSTRNLLGDYSYPAHIETLITLRGLGFSDHPLPESIKLVEDYADMISVLAAIRQAVAPGDGGALRPRLRRELDRHRRLCTAVEAAQQADVAVVVVGDKAGLVPDCTSGEFRDSAHLTLPGVQQELVEAVLATGTPVVLVLVAGRPYPIPQLVETAPAVIHAWLPGAEGARAGRDPLRRRQPGREAPITVPRHVGQVPIFTRTGRRAHTRSSTAPTPTRATNRSSPSASA
ncbi:MAG: glycoside hydrolase family 3 C-terminal domain-containing protein [Caldilineaceae bacterium]